MDADSSYGGSDTAQDSHSANNSSLETPSHHDEITTATHTIPAIPADESSNYKNEITVPVNYDEPDFQNKGPLTKQPHYMSTANLNINESLENHSNLEEMSKQYKSTSRLNLADDAKRNSGIDNPAFDHQEKEPITNGRVKSTFDNNKPYNGELNSTAANGFGTPAKTDEAHAEAVNLELINLKPSNGKDVTGPYENINNGMTTIPLKKENDVEIENPYDEYFVPVNEHRKYMRGEKLYVTMDKRNKKSKNKCLCWGICLALVAAAIILGILAAVGIIGGQDAQPVNEVSARNFNGNAEIKKGGLFGGGAVNGGQPPPNDKEVPRALEAQLVIDNLQFDQALAHKNSSQFQQLAEMLEKELRNTLFANDTLNYGPAEIEVKVLDFTPGSVVVRYRIGWKFKEGIHDAKDPIDREMVMKRMTDMLNKNNGLMLEDYHIADNSITANKILDLCKINNNDCEDVCTFNYQTLDFMCLCPEGKMLAENEKNCVDVVYPEQEIHFHSTDEGHPHAHPEPSSEPEPTAELHQPTAEPSSEPEPTSEPHPEPSSEPEPTVEPHPHIHAEPGSEPEPTAEPEANKSEHFDHEHVHVVAAEPTPEPTHNHDNDHHHIHEAIAEPTAEPKSEPTSVPEPNNFENVDHVHVVAAEPTPEPTSMPDKEHKVHEAFDEPSPEPNAEPTPEPNAELTTKPSPELTSEPNAEPTPEPSAEPNPTDAIEMIHHHSTEASKDTSAAIKVIPNIEHEPAAEPATTIRYEEKDIGRQFHDHNGMVIISAGAEIKTEAPTDDMLTTMKVIVSSSEMPTSEPSPNTEASLPNTEYEHQNEGPSGKSNIVLLAKPTLEPSAEPTAEPTPEPTSELVAFTEQSREGSYKASTESSPEPTAEPNATELPTNESMLKEKSIEESSELKIIPIDKEQSTTTESNVTEVSSSSTSESVTVSQTTTTKPDYIPVIVNENKETIESSKEQSTEQYFTIPVFVNGESKEIKTTVQTEATKPEIYEVTPVPGEMHEKENTTSKHEIMTEATEHPHLENMSPFLPEIENDTFVNTLHSDEHFVDHHDPTNVVHETEPPRLDNDQLNKTNPQDPNPTDTILSVVPLGQENEVTSSPATTAKIFLPTQIPEKEGEKSDSTPNTSSEASVEMITLDNKEQTTTTINYQNSSTTESKTMDNTTILPALSVNSREDNSTEEISTEKNESATLPAEIINNVHSNKYFEEMQAKAQSTELNKVETTTSSTTSTTSMLDIIAKEDSTEDLIAMETTTHLEPKNESVSSVTVVTPTMENYTTIHADIIETVTEVIKVVNESSASDSSSTISSQYEVEESVSDFTTTERLFIARAPIITTTEQINEELSVLPLNPENDIQDDSNDLNHISEESKEKYEKLDRKDMFGKNYYEKSLKDIPTTTEDIPSTTLANINSGEMRTFEIKPVTEGFTLNSFLRCASDQFQCVNGTSTKDGSYCISVKDRCDSIEDCTDGSDEVNCKEEGCPNNFQCTSGQCLKRHLVCDGIINCNDGTDEINCENWSCTSEEMSCNQSGRCIPLDWKCDGKSQCHNGEDERNCPNLCSQNNTFHCLEQNTCIPNNWRCDGKSDCLNDEDEKSCTCTEEQFKCQSGGGCINLSDRCNGIEDCNDTSDEWNCLRIDQEEIDGKKNILQIESMNNTWYPVCVDEFNVTFADLVCQELGYAKSTNAESVNKPENIKNVYKLKQDLKYGAPILSQLEKVESCDSIISLSCQEFECGGHSTLNSQSARIVGGNKATETQWPSLTLLYNKKYNIQCTATLVSPLWAIASQSCLTTAKDTIPNDWQLYAGSTRFFNNPDNSTVQIEKVRRIIIHPQAKYLQFEYQNDVALVQLSKALVLNRNVSAVCLPKLDIEPRQLCVVTGWGVSKPGDMNRQNYLNYLPVPLTDTNECNSTKHYNGMLGVDKICAGYTDSEKTPCYNDEGAPLMCFSDEVSSWELQGVLSNHDNCGKSNHPAVYTAINNKIKEWIFNTIGRKAFTNHS